MSIITFKHRGSFAKTDKSLSKALNNSCLNILDEYGRKGVDLLSAATPVDTGETAASWSYKKTKTKYGYKLSWNNSSNTNGMPIAILIQYGHATRNGSFIEGVDFINPKIKPMFEDLSNRLWKEVNV